MVFEPKEKARNLIAEYLLGLRNFQLFNFSHFRVSFVLYQCS